MECLKSFIHLMNATLPASGSEHETDRDKTEVVTVIALVCGLVFQSENRPSKLPFTIFDKSIEKQAYLFYFANRQVFLKMPCFTSVLMWLTLLKQNLDFSFNGC